MKSLQRMATFVGAAAALMLSVGCGDYTYFNVSIKLKDSGNNWVEPATQNQISNCMLTILYNGSRIEDEIKLTKIDGTDACRGGQTPVDVGTMNYSTAKKSGKLQFIVSMYRSGINPPIIVQGSTEGPLPPSENPKGIDLVAEKCPLTACVDDICEPECPIEITF